MASYLLDIENADKQLKIERLHVGDNGIRTLEFGFVKGGRHMDLDADCTATLYALLPDGTKIYEPCTVKDDKVIYTLKGGTDLPSLTALEGEITAELRLTFGSGEVITSPSFSVFCDAVLQDDGAIEAQESFSALTSALAKVLNFQKGLDSKIDRIDAPEGNLAVFGPDGTVADGGAPSIIYTVDYNGTDQSIIDTFNLMLNEKRPFTVMIRDAHYLMHAQGAITERGTPYVTGIYRDSSSEFKYTVTLNTQTGVVTRTKEPYVVSGGGVYAVPYYDNPTDTQKEEIRAAIEAAKTDDGVYSVLMVLNGGEGYSIPAQMMITSGASTIVAVFRASADASYIVQHTIQLTGAGNVRCWSEEVAVGGGAVSSVNGKTGAVELTAKDVGALPDTTMIPTDEHINSLISTALGVIENGTY